MKNKTKVEELDAALVQMQKQSAFDGVSAFTVQRFGRNEASEVVGCVPRRRKGLTYFASGKCGSWGPIIASHANRKES